jgi:hypothetical protein
MYLCVCVCTRGHKHPRYQKMERTTTAYSQVVTSVSASCSTYKIGQLPNVPIGVSTSFELGVAALPLAYSADEYFTFVDNYGTHFASNLLMGGKTVRQCTLTTEEYSNLTTTGELRALPLFHYYTVVCRRLFERVGWLGGQCARMMDGGGVGGSYSGVDWCG